MLVCALWPWWVIVQWTKGAWWITRTSWVKKSGRDTQTRRLRQWRCWPLEYFVHKISCVLQYQHSSSGWNPWKVFWQGTRIVELEDESTSYCFIHWVVYLADITKWRQRMTLTLVMKLGWWCSVVHCNNLPGILSEETPTMHRATT